jgi:squalene-hopene/tetraprenyl-beta-curcumene cyclase
MKTILLTMLLACAAEAQSANATQAQTTNAKTWNSQTAAAYLDGRMAWWSTWPSAKRDHETFCVSCHTLLPYALGRPALRGPLHEQSVSAGERAFLDNMSKRVSIWDEAQPFYNDEKHGVGKSAEARATEAVMNALILARYDAPKAKDAARNMWALQLKSGDKAGSWTWLNFHNEPWEADDSAFWGASLGGLAAGAAPDPAYKENVALLAGYLQREQQGQSTLNRAVALWASGKLPQLLTADQRSSIAGEILSKQHEDGGWSESSLVLKGWKRKDGTPMDEASDGYGTALMTVALRESGVTSAQPAVAKGIAWLEHNQDAGGAWLATSMNKKRDPASDAGRFMSDAATAYAVLALGGER